jgi:hypothetical protein
MSEKKTKTIYWGLKILSIVISCAFPIFAICEKFPIWTITHGAGRTVGAGGILILIVVVVIFRKSVFNFMRDRMKLQHAPPLVIWLVMIIVGYVLMYINKFIQDMTTIFWMGLIGCAIGTLTTYIAESKFGKKDESYGA